MIKMMYLNFLIFVRTRVTKTIKKKKKDIVYSINAGDVQLLVNTCIMFFVMITCLVATVETNQHNRCESNSIRTTWRSLTSKKP